MNPFAVAREIEADYKAFLRSNFRAADAQLRADFEASLDKADLLVKEPYVALASPFAFGPTLGELGLDPAIERRFAEAVFMREPYRPYLHQSDAAMRIAAGEPTVVATGTGSGKTESFLLPILDYAYRHRGEKGVKAIILYPMNALAIDQKKRIAELCRGLGITFGAYVGSTGRGKRPPDAYEEERCTREEFAAEPPDLLLTNYQMLEYMLLRDDGRQIFGSNRTRFIVLDEVHSYRGILGSDVALLLRRLKATLKAANSEGAPIVFVGTSATLQKDPEGKHDPKEGVATFFSRLIGETVTRDAVIDERTRPVVETEAALGPSPRITRTELDALNLDDSAQVQALAKRLAGPSSEPDAMRALAHAPIAHFLRSAITSPRGLGGVVDELGAVPERAGVEREFLETEVEAAILLGPLLPPDVPQVLPRVHRFVRGLPSFTRCVNPECGALHKEGKRTCDQCGSYLYPLLICKTCGQDYFELAGYDAKQKEADFALRVDEARLEAAADDGDSGVGAALQADDDDSEGNDVAVEDADEDAGELTLFERLEANASSHIRLCRSCGAINAGDASACQKCDAELSATDDAYRWNRLNRCVVCESGYARGVQIRALKLSNSPAVAWIARASLRALPVPARKLLIFADSRQDAAHQARFIDAIEEQLFTYRALVQGVSEAGMPLDVTGLATHLVNEMARTKRFRENLNTAAGRERAFKLAMGRVLATFIYDTKRNDGLEHLGLVDVEYPELAGLCESSEFLSLCRNHGLDPHEIGVLVKQLLDILRTKAGAFLKNVDAEKDPLREFLSRYTDHKSPMKGLAFEYGLVLGRGMGTPIGYAEPNEAGSRGKNPFKIEPLYSPLRGGPLRYLLDRQGLGDEERLVVARGLFDLLVECGLLELVSIGRGKERATGYALPLTSLQVRLATTFALCQLCATAVGNGNPGDRCPKPRCQGRLGVSQSIADSTNTDLRAILADDSIVLAAAEHSAALPARDRDDVEQRFQATGPIGDKAPLNVLVCTPTLEVGVNIGALEAVTMRNVPPSPSNYAQRAGRTGRRTRMGIIHTFAMMRPHDGYFFDHPGEMIAGEIPPPRFNLENREGIERHLHSIALELARLSYDKDLAVLITKDGELAEEPVAKLREAIAGVTPVARERALQVTVGIADVQPEWVESVVSDTADLVVNALQRRADAVKNAVQKYELIGIADTQAQKKEKERWERLAVGLRRGNDDDQSAYLPRLLAEAGIIPGYAFPRDPGSLTLGFDSAPIFASRLQAQREYAPGQTVYARRERWGVQGVAVFRPDKMSATAMQPVQYQLCACGQANPVGTNACVRDGEPVDGPVYGYLDVGTFYASEKKLDPLSEEERSVEYVEIGLHPQADGQRKYYTLGGPGGDGITLTRSERERLWSINRGRSNVRVNDGEPEPYRLCTSCGRYFPPPTRKEKKGKRGEPPIVTYEPSQQEQDHAKSHTCDGEVGEFSIGHEYHADTLRIPIPGGLASDESMTWAHSVGAALLQGAVRHFSLDPDDLSVAVLTSQIDPENPHAVELLLVDDVIGGSGIIAEVVEEFSAIALAALEHLEDHDCDSACYRCIRTYRNSRYFKWLSWRATLPFLFNAERLKLEGIETEDRTVGDQDDPEWQAARSAGCGSPLEHKLLLAIREIGAPEPEKQFNVYRENGSLISSADFAWADKRLLVYVDGLKYHSSNEARILDSRITRLLQGKGWEVLRYVGPEVWRDPLRCAREIAEHISIDTKSVVDGA